MVADSARFSGQGRGNGDVDLYEVDCRDEGDFMKTFGVAVTVKKARGSQFWHVRAETAEDALLAYNAGKGEFVAEDIEVEELAPISLSDIEQVDE